MKLHQLFEQDDPLQYGDNPIQDKDEDETQLYKADTRKTRVTLAHITRLRQLHDLKIKEYHDSLKDIRAQYKPADEGADEAAF